MNACSCYMAPDQGCSVPHGSALLPLMSTKISLCLCCYSNMHRMNAAGLPLVQTETPHLNNDSLVLNNAYTVGLNSATTTCCFTYNCIHGVTNLSQMRGYGVMEINMNKTTTKKNQTLTCEHQEKRNAFKQPNQYTMLWHPLRWWM